MTELPLFLIVSLALLGTTSGFLGGLLGIGGGVVIVPCLIILLEISGLYPAHTITVVAIATSLACIVFTSMSAAITQIRANKVLWDLVRKLALFFILGSFCAGVLIPYLTPWILRLLIGLFLLFVAVVMLTNWKPAPNQQFPGLLGASGIAFGGGLVAGSAGIAGGNVIVPTLVYFNIPPHNATATSSALGVPIAAAGAVSYMFTQNTEVQSLSQVWHWGYVDISSFILISIFAVISAPLGVKVAHRVQADTLKKYFGALLIVVSGRMVWTALL